MKGESNFLKYFILTDIGSLSMKKRISIVLIPLIFNSCLILSMFIDSHEILLLPLLFGIYVFIIGLGHPIIFYERYDDKYGVYSKIRFGSTYQMVSKSFSLILPGLVIIILTVGLILNNLLKGFLISFALVIPFLALFFRTDVFNDDSSIDGDEIILGYNPGPYGMLSIFLGVFGYLNVYNLLKYDFNFAIILFCITFIFQVLLLIPDKCNKILFFDIRRKKGFLTFIFSLITIFLVICSMMSYSPIISFNQIDLSFESIIRKVIVWGVVIVLSILFARQIKKMGK